LALGMVQAWAETPRMAMMVLVFIVAVELLDDFCILVVEPLDSGPFLQIRDSISFIDIFVMMRMGLVNRSDMHKTARQSCSITMCRQDNSATQTRENSPSAYGVRRASFLYQALFSSSYHGHGHKRNGRSDGRCRCHVQIGLGLPDWATPVNFGTHHFTAKSALDQRWQPRQVEK
jgi:hypothetical protein